MEKNLIGTSIADYRIFLLNHERRSIRKIEVAGPDIASIEPAIRPKMAGISRPYDVLLTVFVPSINNIMLYDMISLLDCIGGAPGHLNVRWGVCEDENSPTVRVVAYVAPH